VEGRQCAGLFLENLRFTIGPRETRTRAGKDLRLGNKAQTVNQKIISQMTTSLLPISPGGGVEISPANRGEKIIQRIRHAAGSYPLKARMADADDDLVLQCQNGNVAAFEMLVRKHQQMVHALTFRMTGSVADAEDLAQEAFIRAYEQIGAFRSQAKFSTWLYSIAVHACLNWRRDEARRFRAEANCAREAFAEHHESAPNEMAQQAQAALMKLPARQRAAIVLTFYDGLSHAEAAKVLRCSETTVSWRVFAAKRKLKQWLTTPVARELPENGNGEEGALEHE
jgi:RNA polymerase sigma-70 factor (ECF subfamily)